MEVRRERFCDCGMPLGVPPHYCEANNLAGNGYRARAPGPYNGRVGYGAPNGGGYYRQPPRPVMRPHPQAPPPLPLYGSGSGNKRALLCGITYGKGRHALKGSVNDVLRMKAFLIDYLGFHPHSIVVLRDDQYNDWKTVPTKANMIEAMKTLVRGCKAGDSLVFHYSGHGSRIEDNDMDEVDGYDEALCPVDYEDAGKIRDDTINDVLVKPLPRGTKLHAIIDTCSSGTVLDLPFMCRMNRFREYKWDDQMIGKPHYKGTNGGVAVCISACDDDGTSGDTSAFGMNGGALTHSFIQAMKNKPGGMSYGNLLHSMRSMVLEAKKLIGLDAYQQRFHVNNPLHYVHEPQLSSSEKFDIHSRPVVI
ncbi:metacaspase-3-like [Prosopis cineraria]|uniref:metacaspase-3-like n=1 Tax=Prosopis cineraria TaxID=364024 RepID=UPI0024104742|nr:metacaspase-3-like [Prosopis cineraria]